jgi:hypothetical protein
MVVFLYKKNLINPSSFLRIIIFFKNINKMLITNLKELQSYREFQTIASINLVRTAVINNIAPAGLTQIQTNRFNKKFSNNEWEVVNIPLDRRANPAHGVNRLIYKPNNKLVYLYLIQMKEIFI